MNTGYIISQSLIEYDKRRPIIDILTKKKNKTQIVRGQKSTERDVIKIYDKNDNIILESEFEILGSYYPLLKVWNWAWANPGFVSPQNYLSKEILNHAIEWTIDLTYLKSMVINSRTIITDTIQLDINIAFGASVIKHYYIYPYINKTKNTEMIHYLILLNETYLDGMNKKD